MLKSALGLFTLVSVFFCTQISAAPILILGDSLSASYGVDEDKGWVNLLRAKLPEHEIINGSVSGETTAGGLRRLPALLESAKPELILIELGGNDGLRGFTPQQLKENLTKIITLSQAKDVEVLLSEIMVPPNYGPRYASMFSQVYKDLASEHQITLLPFFMTQIATKPELMQRDGIHPNAEAQGDIAEFILPWVKNAL
ncbi:arylesterase [Shewanella canadensis]|uniref:Arylesterase n=1 Tax=Shewanella canadensis TaxID=271096 RepID=A0A431WRT6_9GAMM|nr:arylesterase [Shewanella canadensis]RTR37925.1 arylesterase [Shewanella canadensis]